MNSLTLEQPPTQPGLITLVNDGFYLEAAQRVGLPVQDTATALRALMHYAQSAELNDLAAAVAVASSEQSATVMLDIYQS